MVEASRRDFLIGGAALPAGAAAAAALPVTAEATVADDLKAYIDFGNKQAGGPGDVACGNWLASELEKTGFAIQRQTFEAPFFTPDVSELTCGTAKAAVWPQPIVVSTGPEGVTGPLVRIDSAGRAAGPLAGAIALLELASARWSSATAKPIREPIVAAFAAGAKAVAVITSGPTGQVIALNADGRKPMFAGPVALLAPNDAGLFLASAMHHATATLRVSGTGGRRPAFNFVGRIDRRKPRWLVVSTPRSGWSTCAGERGPGVAIWLQLARWASRNVREHNVAFICNSGHEYEYLGAGEAVKEIAPKPADTHFWLHLGAGAAARDWHELAGQWKPLPSVDSQRCLSISPALLPVARDVFRGHVGFEAPYASDLLAAGELVEIIAAGYTPAAGIFGSHRFHHVADDDGRCVSAPAVAVTGAVFAQFLQKII